MVTQSQGLPRFDVQAPLLSLPRLLGTTSDSIPLAARYLEADPIRVERYLAILGAPRCLRVGLAWAGSPRHVTDRLRSIPLAKLAPLKEIPGVEWHNLQVEEPALREACRSGSWLRPQLDSPDADYLAALMTCLDLVVSVDSMPAHLAGALGRPVLTLLPWAADWRWGARTATSPWYPGMRLLRQPKPGDWEDVVERTREEIRTFSFKFSPPAPIRLVKAGREAPKGGRFRGNGMMPNF